VPSRSQPARSPRLARAAAAVIVVAVVVGITYLLTTRHSPLVSEPTACAVSAGRQDLELTVGQAGIAATIAGVAARRELPVRAVQIAYATALQESKLTNLDYGDRDSVGVFQQRPSEGWGTPRQIENPIYASGRFFAALAAVPGYQHLPVYEAAQDVQHSADGGAYGQYATVGAQLANAFYGTSPHAFWCYYSSPAGKPRLTAAAHALTSAFGQLPAAAGGDPAMAIQVPKARLGWAVAAWLISHAGTFGISNVRYRGYIWLRGKGAGKWVRRPAPARAPAAPNAVVFG
jgi:hypothetical protein